jgi:hypothetical protein
MTVNEKEMDQDHTEREVTWKLASYTMPKLTLKDLLRGIGEEEDDIKLKKPQQIVNKEEDYMKRRLKKLYCLIETMLSPWET